MAKMYPDFGPKSNDSPVAEPALYRLLREGLSDEYSVIHSIPWLSSALVEIYNDPSGVGEVDFLVIHPTHGVLAIEVKGGNFCRNHNGFYYSKGESKSHFDPYNQLNRGVFAIQKALIESNLHTRFGKAYYFPKENLGFNLPLEYLGQHEGKRVRFVIDKADVGNEISRVVHIMEFYKYLLDIKPIGLNGVEKIIQCLLPQGHGKACWIARIKDDNRTWLKLTSEQEYYANQAVANNRTLVTGWPGSGKTIVLIHACRQIVSSGKRALVVTFNRLLSEKIARELDGERNCKVISFYKLCGAYNSDAESVFHDESTLQKIVLENKLSEFDVLLVDEGQAISEEAWKLFADSFKDKQIVVMCDDAQVFCYEHSVSETFLSELLGVRPYLLTESLRMPKAVCEELKLFSQPYYSVINKRNPEKDTLHRIVTHDQSEKLRLSVARLLSDGIAKEDICVLKPGYLTVPAELVPSGVDVESIGRFRGMEKPIVIIYSSERITSSEFFCAYSRATSRCIVILDANNIKKKRYGELGKLLYASNPSKIDEIAEKGLMKNKIKSFCSGRQSVIDDFIKLEWYQDWQGFLFYCDADPLIQELLMSHLELKCETGIVGWSNKSVEYLRLTGNPRVDLGNQIGNGAILSFCSDCGMLSPKYHICFSCRPKKLNQDDKSRLVSRISELNELLQKRKSLTDSERENICPFLSAALLVMNNPDDFKNPLVVNAIESANSFICQAVIVHVMYLIFNNKGNARLQITNKKVIAFMVKCIPSIYQTMSVSSFAGHVADGMSKLVELEVLERVGKGVCEVNAVM
ncbi:nuclease-related domain-containing DEAD/DEAH box helicase [Pseudoalteromonas xiamenensis]